MAEPVKECRSGREGGPRQAKRQTEKKTPSTQKAEARAVGRFAGGRWSLGPSAAVEKWRVPSLVGTQNTVAAIIAAKLEPFWTWLAPY